MTYPPTPPGPPPPPPGPPGPPPGQPAMGPAPSGTNQAAIISLVAGLVGFVVCPLIAHIVAIVYGLKARKELAEPGNNQEGSGLAIAGLVLGIIGVVLMLAAVAFGVIGALMMAGAENATGTY